MIDSASEEDRRILQEMVGRSGSPAFIRRAKLVETTWTDVLALGAKARLERLTMVRLRLGQLRALAGSWIALRSRLAETDLVYLSNLHDELQPRLRLPLQSTTTTRVLRAAAHDLVEAMEMFNARWARWLAKVDLRPVNQARDDYNRYYLFEKECSVGSARVARIGFKKQDPVTLDDLIRQFPALTVPRFDFSA